MNPQQPSPLIRRQRQLLLVLPLLTLPFVTLAFWALGGGGKTEAPPAAAEINAQLPQPQFRTEKENKLSFYDVAAAAEKKRLDALRADPYWVDTLTAWSMPGNYTGINDHLGRLYPPEIAPAPDDAEAQLLLKLEQLDKEIRKPYTPPRRPEPVHPATPPIDESVHRLEQMMALMQENKTEHTEMAQLEAVLDRIIDIQHPERVSHKEELPPSASGQVVVSVQPTRNVDSGFYGLSDPESGFSNTITAVVHGTQTLTDGAPVRLRLQEAWDLSGITLPQGHILYGQARIQATRLHIHIRSIRYGGALYPVALDLFDLDGLSGIYIPGTAIQELAQEAGGKMLQAARVSSLNPSLPGQAVEAGLNTVKSLFSKKSKQVKVTLKEGHLLFLQSKH